MTKTLEWWGPDNDKYSRPHMLWLVKHLRTLNKGEWPLKPTGSSYTDAPTRGAVKREASFAKAKGVAADVESRLEKCRADGLMSEARYSWGKSDDFLCGCFNISYEELDSRIERTLTYISGHYRKWMGWTDQDGYHPPQTYKFFKAHRWRRN